MLLRAGDVGALGRTIHSIPGVLGYLGDATHKTKFVVVPQVDGPDSIEVSFVDFALLMSLVTC